MFMRDAWSPVQVKISIGFNAAGFVSEITGALGAALGLLELCMSAAHWLMPTTAGSTAVKNISHVQPTFVGLEAPMPCWYVPVALPVVPHAAVTVLFCVCAWWFQSACAA
jgi:hypothetical protein